MLEHMASHILFDSHVDKTSLPCGLCLRPAPSCTFFIKGGKNTQIDMKKSTCASIVNFNYGTARESTNSSPASNVPIKCPECRDFEPAVWRYNLHEHFKQKHPNIPPARYGKMWEIGEDEVSKLKKIWDSRHTVRKTRTKKKGTSAIQISEAHSSRMAGRYVNTFIAWL